MVATLYSLYDLLNMEAGGIYKTVVPIHQVPEDNRFNSTSFGALIRL